MTRRFATPQTKRVPVLLGGGLYVFDNFVAGPIYLYRVVQEAPPRSTEDSFFILLYWKFGVSILLAPLFVGLMAYAFRRYRPQVPLLAWNRQRPLWSLFWSAVGGFLCLYLMRDFCRFVRFDLPVLGIVPVLWAYVVVVGRANLVARCRQSEVARQ